MVSQSWRFAPIIALSVAPMGCQDVGKSPTETLQQVSAAPLQAAPLTLEIPIHGRLTLAQLATTLTPHGLRLTYPPDRRETLLDFAGLYDADRLASALETALECELIRAGPDWSLVWSDGAWNVVTPRLADSQLPGVQAQNIGGRWVYSGDPAKLPGLRRIVDILSKPRGLVRLRCLITDDSRSWAIGLTHPAEDVRFGISSLSISFDSLVTIAAEASAVVTEFEGLLTDGVDWTYSDSVERRVPNHGVTDNGTLLPTSFEVVSAGLKLSAWAAHVDGNWRLVGTLSVTDFVGTNADDLATAGRHTDFDLDLAPGSCVRLVRLGDRRHGVTTGITGDTLGASGSGSRRSWSLWVTVEPVTMTSIDGLAPPTVTVTG